MSKTVTPKKKKNLLPVTRGNIYVRSSFNNTVITVTDESGGVIGWITAGACGFKGAKKATPFAAQTAMSRLIEKVRNRGLRQINIYVSGVGNGRDAAIRVLTNYDFEVLKIKDITPIAHNGCRPKKIRRV